MGTRYCAVLVCRLHILSRGLPAEQGAEWFLHRGPAVPLFWRIRPGVSTAKLLLRCMCAVQQPADIMRTRVKVGVGPDGRPCSIFTECPADCLGATTTRESSPPVAIAPPPANPATSPTAGVLPVCGLSGRMHGPTAGHPIISCSGAAWVSGFGADCQQPPCPTVMPSPELARNTPTADQRLDMMLCTYTSCAGGNPTNPSACDEEFPSFNCATCDLGGCATCDEGFYTYPFIATGVFNHCEDCQQLNCAPGSCSDGIGASPDSTDSMSRACHCAYASSKRSLKFADTICVPQQFA
jgi:hypothetical protein